MNNKSSNNNAGRLVELSPDLDLTVNPVDEFEQKKRELLSNPYFCGWTENEVSDFLIKRLDELSIHYQMPYRAAAITFDAKIWGSCSWDNCITLNFNMALLPERVRDYLFLHELVHTRIKGHGQDFWQELDSITQNKARMLEQELKKHKMTLPFYGTICDYIR